MYKVKNDITFSSNIDEALARTLQSEINSSVTLTDEEIARVLQNEIKNELSLNDRTLAENLQDEIADGTLFTDNFLAQALQNESTLDSTATSEGFTTFLTFINSKGYSDEMSREYGAGNHQEKRDAALAQYIHDRDYAYKLQVETDAEIARELANENTDPSTSPPETEGATGSNDRDIRHGAGVAFDIDGVDVGDGYEVI